MPGRANGALALASLPCAPAGNCLCMKSSKLRAAASPPSPACLPRSRLRSTQCHAQHATHLGNSMRWG